MISKNGIIKSNGHFHMDDSSSNPQAQTEAQAEAKVYFNNGTEKIILQDGNPKTDIITTAKVAGIQAAKKTSDFIPLHHTNTLNWIAVDISAEEKYLKILSTVKAISRSSLEMEALTAVSVAALTIVDLCKESDPGITIQDLKLVPRKTKKKILTVKTSLKVGIIVISDRVIAGLAEDDAGQILKEGFKDAGYQTDNYTVISNDADKLVEKIQDWLEQGIELVVTTGGNGIGPRDITLSSLEPFFDYRLEGVEQTLHSIAQIHNQGFYVDRLAAGKIGKTIVICLPMDPDLAQDALNVFLPNIHQAFEF